MNNKKICEEIENYLFDVIENMNKANSLDCLNTLYGKALAYNNILKNYFKENTDYFQTKIKEAYLNRYNEINYFVFEVAGKKYKAKVKNQQKIEELLSLFDKNNYSNEKLKQWTDFLKEIDLIENIE